MRLLTAKFRRALRRTQLVTPGLLREPGRLESATEGHVRFLVDGVLQERSASSLTTREWRVGSQSYQSASWSSTTPKTSTTSSPATRPLNRP